MCSIREKRPPRRRAMLAVVWVPWVLWSGVMVGAAVPAGAQTPSPEPALGASTTTTPLSDMDRRFVTQALTAAAVEVELGRLAEQRGSGQVQQFGARMVQDHGRAADELRAMADAKGVPIPRRVEREASALQSQFQSLSGAAFDKVYAQRTRADHEQAVALFDKQAIAGGDADLKAWAAKTLPALREHLARAKSLADNPVLGK